jgi:hypothetical protein
MLLARYLAAWREYRYERSPTSEDCNLQCRLMMPYDLVMRSIASGFRRS